MVLLDTVVGILGPTTLRIADRVGNDWGAPRERALLAVLALHAGQPVSMDTLVDWVWPEGDEFPRRSTFHTYATRIRRALEQVDTAATLVPDHGGYRLDLNRLAVDYHRFRKLMSEARELRRRGRTRQASLVGGQALALWRGQPLVDVRTDRARNWRRRVTDDEWLPANSFLIETLMELGEYDAALTRLDDLQTEHPHHLALAELRLAVLYGLARYTDAQTYYLHTRRRLLDDVDEEAADHLREFHATLVGARRKNEPPVHADSPVAPRQLPHDLPAFVGREQQLRELDDAVGQRTSGVVVIAGMAGVGKTALAVHWAHRLRDRFPDAQLHVDLCGYADSPRLDSSTVVDTFLAALGHDMDANASLQARRMRLSNLLADRRALVLLDNVGDAGQVADLIPLLSNSVVIVTSRRQLGRLGASHVHVGQMTTPEAMALLASEIGTRLRTSTEQLTDLAAVCAGLPLAITLVAQHAALRPHVDLADYVARLGHSLALLKMGEDDSDATVTLEAVFSWSYHGLHDAEQRLFRLLGLHPGPDISLAVAVAAGGRTPDETTRSLDVLVGAHLLQQPTSLDRYRFHDLIRDYAHHVATHRAPEGEQHAAERRYLSFYLASARAAEVTVFPANVGLPQPPVEDRVAPLEFTDPQQAMAWCIRERINLDAVTYYAVERGYQRHAYLIPHSTSILYRCRGYNEASRAMLEVAVSSARAVGDEEALAASLQQLALVQTTLGAYGAARAHLDDALRIVTGIGHDVGQAYVLHAQARLAAVQGDLATATDTFLASLEAALRTDNLDVQCWNHYRLGEVLRARAQYDQALPHLHQARWLADKISDPTVPASIAISLGALFADRGDYTTAEAFCFEALDVIVDFRVVEAGAHLCLLLARISQGRDRYRDARDYLRRGVSLFRSLCNSAGEAAALDKLADTHSCLGNRDAAEEGWEQAAALYRDLEKPALVHGIELKLADVRVRGAYLPRMRPGPSKMDAAAETGLA